MGKTINKGPCYCCEQSSSVTSSVTSSVSSSTSSVTSSVSVDFCCSGTGSARVKCEWSHDGGGCGWGGQFPLSLSDRLGAVTVCICVCAHMSRIRVTLLQNDVRRMKWLLVVVEVVLTFPCPCQAKLMVMAVFLSV